MRCAFIHSTRSEGQQVSDESRDQQQSLRIHDSGGAFSERGSGRQQSDERPAIGATSHQPGAGAVAYQERQKAALPILGAHRVAKVTQSTTRSIWFVVLIKKEREKWTIPFPSFVICPFVLILCCYWLSFDTSALADRNNHCPRQTVTTTRSWISRMEVRFSGTLILLSLSFFRLYSSSSSLWYFLLWYLKAFTECFFLVFSELSAIKKRTTVKKKSFLKDLFNIWHGRRDSEQQFCPKTTKNRAEFHLWGMRQRLMSILLSPQGVECPPFFPERQLVNFFSYILSPLLIPPITLLLTFSLSLLTLFPRMDSSGKRIREGLESIKVYIT